MSDPYEGWIYVPGCDCGFCRQHEQREQRDALAERLDAFYDCLYHHSKRMDQNHDIAMVLEGRIADLSADLAVNVRYLEELLRNASKRARQIGELEARISDHDRAQATLEIYLQRLERKIASLEAQVAELQDGPPLDVTVESVVTIESTVTIDLGNGRVVPLKLQP